MKFVVALVAVLAVASARTLIGNTAQKVVDGTDCTVLAADQALTHVVNGGKGIVGGLVGPKGIAGGLIQGGLGDLLGGIVTSLDKATGLNLGCILNFVLSKYIICSPALIQPDRSFINIRIRSSVPVLTYRPSRHFGYQSRCRYWRFDLQRISPGRQYCPRYHKCCWKHRQRSKH